MKMKQTLKDAVSGLFHGQFWGKFASQSPAKAVGLMLTIFAAWTMSALGAEGKITVWCTDGDEKVLVGDTYALVSEAVAAADENGGNSFLVEIAPGTYQETSEVILKHGFSFCGKNSQNTDYKTGSGYDVVLNDVVFKFSGNFPELDMSFDSLKFTGKSRINIGSASRKEFVLSNCYARVDPPDLGQPRYKSFIIGSTASLEKLTCRENGLVVASGSGDDRVVVPYSHIPELDICGNVFGDSGLLTSTPIVIDVAPDGDSMKVNFKDNEVYCRVYPSIIWVGVNFSYWNGLSAFTVTDNILHFYEEDGEALSDSRGDNDGYEGEDEAIQRRAKYQEWGTKLNLIIYDRVIAVGGGRTVADVRGNYVNGMCHNYVRLRRDGNKEPIPIERKWQRGHTDGENIKEVPNGWVKFTDIYTNAATDVESSNYPDSVRNIGDDHYCANCDVLVKAVDGSVDAGKITATYELSRDFIVSKPVRNKFQFNFVLEKDGTVVTSDVHSVTFDDAGRDGAFKKGQHTLVWDAQSQLGIDKLDGVSCSLAFTEVFTGEFGNVGNIEPLYATNVLATVQFLQTKSEGPIKLWRTNDGEAEEYLGGFSLVSKAVAKAESDSGKSFRIQIPADGVVYGEEEHFINKINVGTFIPSTKSLRIVGGYKYVDKDDNKGSFESVGKKGDESSYQSIISNCVFVLNKPDEGEKPDFTLENVCLAGKSHVALGAVLENNWPKARGNAGDGLDTLTITNCYCKLSNEGFAGSLSFYNRLYADNILVTSGSANDVQAQNENVRIVENTIVPAASGSAKLRITSGKMFVLGKIEIRCNIIGSEACPLTGTVYANEDYPPSVAGKENALIESNTVYETIGAFIVEANLRDTGGCDPEKPAQISVYDNEIYCLKASEGGGYEECTLAEISAENNGYFVVGFFGSVDEKYLQYNARGNHVNGYCFNRAKPGLVSTHNNSQQGHDATACDESLGTRMVMVGGVYSNQVAKFSGQNLTPTEPLTTTYCTNCCKLGYVVTFNPDNGASPWSVALTNFFRNAAIPGAPTKVAEPDPAPTKEGRACTGWYNGGEKWNFGSDVTSSMTLKAAYELPSGPIKVFLLDGGKEVYLGGFDLVSKAVAMAEATDGGSFKILVTTEGASTSPVAYTEALSYWSVGTVKKADMDGTHITCTKSYRFVGEGSPDHLSAETYPAILSNCVFDVKGEGCNYSFENLRLEGMSRIAQDKVKSISVGNCYANVSNQFEYLAYHQTNTRNAFIIAEGNIDNIIRESLTITNNTIICKDVEMSTDNHVADRWLTGAVFAPVTVVANNVFGSEKAGEKAPCGVFYPQGTTIADGSQLYFTNNIGFFGPSASGHYVYPAFVELNNKLGRKLSVVFSDNSATFDGCLDILKEIPEFIYNADGEKTDEAVDYCYIQGSKGDVEVTGTGNYFNGSCYNYAHVESRNKTKKESMLVLGHNMSSNIQALPDGLDVVYDYYKGYCADTSTLDDRHYCTNCCVLGYRVTFDTDGGTTNDVPAVYNPTNMPTQYRAKNLKPAEGYKLVLPDTAGLTKDGRPFRAWVENGTGKTWTGGEVIDHSMTLKAAYFYKPGDIDIPDPDNPFDPENPTKPTHPALSNFSVTNCYDGTAHTINTNALRAAALEGMKDSMGPVKIEYSWTGATGTWQPEPFTAIHVADSTSFWYKVSAPDYLDYVHAASVVVTQRVATVTADDKSKTFGDKDPPLTATEVTGVADGFKLVYGVTRATGEDVNTYPITLSGEMSQGDYTVVYVPGTFTINPKGAATFTVEIGAAEPYNGREQKPTVTVKDGNTTLVEGKDYTLTWPEDCANAGEKSVTVTGVGNYAGSSSDGTYVIPPRPVWLASKGWTWVYDGKAHTTNEATRTSALDFVAGETVATNFYATITNVGEKNNEFDVTFIGAKPGNYALTLATNTLKVTARSIDPSKSRVELFFDGTNFTYTAQDQGPVLEKVIVDGIEFGPENFRLEGDVTKKNATNATESVYTVWVVPAEGNANFEGECDAGWTISPASLTVRANDETVQLGDPVPAYTWTGSGWKGEDGPGQVDASKVGYECRYTRTSPVGTYPIDVSGLTSRNYAIEYAQDDDRGKVTVNAAGAVTVTLQGNVLETTYDGKEHSTNGWTVAGITDDRFLPGYITITNGAAKAEAKGTDVATYQMGVKSGDFGVVEAQRGNFPNVVYVWTDGYVKIGAAGLPDPQPKDREDDPSEEPPEGYEGTPFDWYGCYDGKGHTVQKFTFAPGAVLTNAKVLYSPTEGGAYTEELVKFIDVTNKAPVYVKIVADNYSPLYTNAFVTITQRVVHVEFPKVTKVYDGTDACPPPGYVATNLTTEAENMVAGERIDAEGRGHFNSPNVDASAFILTNVTLTAVGEKTKLSNYCVYVGENGGELFDTDGEGQGPATYDGDDPRWPEEDPEGPAAIDPATVEPGEVQTDPAIKPIDPTDPKAPEKPAEPDPDTKPTDGSADGIDATGDGYWGEYDGLDHGVSMTVVKPAGVQPQYWSAGDNAWKPDEPSFKNASTNFVWIKVEDPNYETFVTNLAVIITPRSIENALVSVTNDPPRGKIKLGDKLTFTAEDLTLPAGRTILTAADYGEPIWENTNKVSKAGAMAKLILNGQGNYKDSVTVEFWIYARIAELKAKLAWRQNLSTGKLYAQVKIGCDNLADNPDKIDAMAFAYPGKDTTPILRLDKPNTTLSDKTPAVTMDPTAVNDMIATQSNWSALYGVSDATLAADVRTTSVPSGERLIALGSGNFLTPDDTQSRLFTLWYKSGDEERLLYITTGEYAAQLQEMPAAEKSLTAKDVNDYLAFSLDPASSKNCRLKEFGVSSTVAVGRVAVLDESGNEAKFGGNVTITILRANTPNGTYKPVNAGQVKVDSTGKFTAQLNGEPSGFFRAKVIVGTLVK